MLTERQYEVARLYASGLSRHETARRLGISHATARSHLSLVFARLGIAHRRELAAALLTTEIGTRLRANKYGITVGQQLRVTGGMRVGRVGTFLRIANRDTLILRIGHGDICVQVKHIEPIDEQEAA